MVEGKKAKNNNMESNFSTPTNILVGNFIYLYWI